MTIRKYSSISQETSLTSALNSSATTMVVGSASALLGGITPASGETFTVVLDPDTALEEIVDVIYPSTPGSNTLTITRPVDGTQAISHSAGAKVRHMAIGRDFREANSHQEASAAVHGLAGTVVGTTDTQTLTNKTLTSPTITGTGAIAGTFTGNLTGNVTGNVSGNAGTVTNGVYTTDVGTVTGTMIANNTIVDADVNSAAGIAKTKIAGTAITAADTGTVTSTMILDGTILNADINAAAAIDKTKISGTAITAADTGTVTSTMIADGTIVNGDVSATAAIAKSKLNLGGTITSADLVDGTIVASDIADGTITAAKMVSDPYARANHTGTQLASTISNFDTQVRTSTLNQMAAPTTSLAMNAQKITGLADPTLAQDASTKAYVDTQVNALVNGAPGTLDTLGEIAAALSSGGSVVSTLVAKAGDTMTGPLVLNANPTVALGAATKQYVDTVAGSATAAAAAQAATEAVYDSFDDRYLGAKSTAPTVDNDGNALLTGALYWNSTSNTMFAWSGSAWGSISSTAAIYRYRFTATGGETTISGVDANGLTLSYLVGKEQVYLNGVLLVRTSDYTASNGTSITSLAALTAGDIVEIITFTSFDLASAIPNTAFNAKGAILVGTAAGTYAVQALGSDGQVLVADSTQSDGVKWASPLPTQTGNSGKYLTTNGSTASWGAIVTDPTPTAFLLMGA